MKLLPSLLLGLALAGAARAADPAEPLRVTWAEHTLRLAPADLAALPRSECTVTDPHTQQALHFSGVKVSELLVRAGAPLGEKLHGRMLRLAVIVRARDGYAVVFGLADFDAAFRPQPILIADRCNDAPLSAKAAPWQLVVPGDQRPARWARMVSSIEVVDLGGNPP